MLVQVTSPALNHIDLKKAKKFLKFDYDSLFSCYENKVFFEKTRNSLKPVNYNYKDRL